MLRRENSAIPDGEPSRCDGWAGPRCGPSCRAAHAVQDVRWRRTVRKAGFNGRDHIKGASAVGRGGLLRSRRGRRPGHLPAAGGPERIRKSSARRHRVGCVERGSARRARSRGRCRCRRRLPSQRASSTREPGLEGVERSRGRPGAAQPSTVSADGSRPHSSSLRAEMKASCGTSTRPIDFIRFLPSFCLSRSLFFRVMSPP